MKKAAIFLIILLLIASSCIPGDGKNTSENKAGFFWGIWHGWIAPVSLIIGFFDRSIRVYEKNNNGWLYDLGFYIAIIGGFGGLSLTRWRMREYRRRRRSNY